MSCQAWNWPVRGCLAIQQNRHASYAVDTPSRAVLQSIQWDTIDGYGVIEYSCLHCVARLKARRHVTIIQIHMFYV